MCILSTGLEYASPNLKEVMENLLIPKSQDPQAFLAQKLFTESIVLLTFCSFVNSSIYFNHKFSSRTVEIYNEAIDRSLPIELDAAMPLPKEIPKHHLGSRSTFSKFFCHVKNRLSYTHDIPTAIQNFAFFTHTFRTRTPHE